MVQRDADGRYGLGLELLRWGRRLARHFQVGDIAEPHMRHLVDTCAETAVLGVYNPQLRLMMYTVSVESPHLLRYTLQMEQWRPIYAGASGQAILAFLDPAEQKQIMEESRLEPLTPNSITDPAALRAHLDDIRQRGVAVTHGQAIPGAVGIAAPIFDRNLEVVGDVCVTVPEQRFDPDKEDDLVAHVITCARDTSTDMGAQVADQVWPPGSHTRQGAER